MINVKGLRVLKIKRVIVFVTSRSGALTKLILWRHLLASDLDCYDDEPLNLDDDAS